MYALPLVPQILSWELDFALHEQRIHTPGSYEEIISAPEAPLITPWQPVFRKRTVHFDNGDNERLDYPNSIEEYVPKSVSETNNKLSSLSQFSNSAIQGSVSQGQSSAWPAPVLEDAIHFSQFEGQPLTPRNRAISLDEIAGQTTLTLRWHDDLSRPESFAAGKPKQKQKRKSGGRKGHMKPDKAREAKDMRERGACTACWAKKVSVSQDAI